MTKGLRPQIPLTATAEGNHITLPPVLTVREVMDLLRISKNTAYEGLRSGAIPGMLRVGSAVRVSGPALARWLAEGSVPTGRGR